MGRTIKPAKTGKLYRAVCRRTLPFNDPATGAPHVSVEAYGPYQREGDAWAAVSREGRYMNQSRAQWTVEETDVNWRPA